MVSAIFVYTITITIAAPRGPRHRPDLHRPHRRHQRLVTHRALDRAARAAGRLRRQREAILDDAALGPQPLRFIANKINAGDRDEYRAKSLDVRMHNHLNARQGAIFLEVEISDASDFATTVHVGSAVVGGHYILRATGPSVPNVLAAVLLDVRDRSASRRTSTSSGARRRRGRTCCASCSPARATSRR